MLTTQSIVYLQTPESGLFTEGSFVLLDGTYTDDSIFKVDEMGHPPGEQRAEARQVARGAPNRLRQMADG